MTKLTWCLFFMFLNEIAGLIPIERIKEDVASKSKTTTQSFEPYEWHDWSYKGKEGPKFWHKWFKSCAGKHQSPINIIPEETVYDPKLTDFAIWFNPPHPNDHMIVYTPGETVKVKTIGKFYVANGGLPNVYKTSQLHFHWGHEDNKGSEHQINSKSYPMELHIVNYDHSKYSSLHEAVTHPLGLAVLGVLFEVTEEDNPALKPIFDVLEEIKKPGHPKIKINAQSIRVFLPKDTSKFYRYNGSLTTPGCYETVIWTVFKQTNHISRAQIKKLRDFFYNKEVGGHPHHRKHHHDHKKLVDEERRLREEQNPASDSKREIPAALQVTVKQQEPSETMTVTADAPKQDIKPNLVKTTEATKADLQPAALKAKEEEKPAEKVVTTEATKADLQPAALKAKAEEKPAEKVTIGTTMTADIPQNENLDASLPKALPADQPPKATSFRSGEISTIKDPQLSQQITEAAPPEMQNDAGYAQHESKVHKHMQHHHKHRHHLNKRDVEGKDPSSADKVGENKAMLNSSEEVNKALEEESQKSEQIYKKIEKEIESLKITRIEIERNYRPIQPLNDRVVLRSFQALEEEEVFLLGYEVQPKPGHTHSMAERPRISTLGIFLVLCATYFFSLTQL